MVATITGVSYSSSYGIGESVSLICYCVRLRFSSVCRNEVTFAVNDAIAKFSGLKKWVNFVESKVGSYKGSKMLMNYYMRKTLINHFYLLRISYSSACMTCKITIVTVAGINVITCPVLGSQCIKFYNSLIKQINFEYSVVFLQKTSLELSTGTCKSVNHKRF